MDPQITRDELAAYFALRTAGDRMQRAVATQLRPFDLTEIQFTILAQLREVGEQRMSDLARVIVASKNGLTYQAAQLEERGLLTRHASGDDARVVLLRIAPAGEELLAQVFPGHIALVRELFLDRLSARELAGIRSGLAKVATD